MNMEKNVSQEIIVSDVYPQAVMQTRGNQYLFHVLCTDGSATFGVSGQTYELHHLDIAIILPEVQINRLSFSSDFKGVFLMISRSIAHSNNPSLQWGDRGFLYSFSNPVFHFSQEQADIFTQWTSIFEQRLADTSHLFYNDVLGASVRTFLYDMWNIYAPLLEAHITSSEGGNIFERFLELLRLHCHQDREVAFYADKLFITPKYLSEVCRKKSGRSAIDWITDYTTQK